MAGPTRSTTNWSTATNHVDYSSSSTAAFIPEIWSGKLVERFYDATVFGAISNTDYEGEIRGYGDNVIIRTIPSISIGDYQIGQALTYSQPTSTKVELAIDKAKFFTFQVDKIDAMQSDLNLMDIWAQAAGEQMKVAIDTGVLASIYADASADNAGATAGRIANNINLGAVGGTNGSLSVSVTNATILKLIVQIGQVLDEQNSPEQGRYIVMPAWMASKLKLSDLKDASITGDGSSVLRNGRLGMIDRFEIYLSNNVAHQTEGTAQLFHVVAGHKKALTFASQMTDMETLPNPSSFGSLVRGLNVYGFKVIDPTLLVHAVVMDGGWA